MRMVVAASAASAADGGRCTGVAAPADMVVNISLLPAVLVNGTDVGAALSCSPASGKFRAAEPAPIRCNSTCDPFDYSASASSSGSGSWMGRGGCPTGAPEKKQKPQ